MCIIYMYMCVCVCIYYLPKTFLRQLILHMHFSSLCFFHVTSIFAFFLLLLWSLMYHWELNFIKLIFIFQIQDILQLRRIFFYEVFFFFLWSPIKFLKISSPIYIGGISILCLLCLSLLTFKSWLKELFSSSWNAWIPKDRSAFPQRYLCPLRE